MKPCTTLCQTLETIPPRQGGTYIVILWLPAKRRLTVGRLGTAELQRGYYSYVGSAKRGLATRLHRHVHGATTRHWHLDYLRPHTRVLSWHAYADERQPECHLAQLLLPFGQVLMPHFGASDCSCSTHLLYYPRRAVVAQALRQVTYPGAPIPQATTQVCQGDWYGGTRAGFAPRVNL